jgi:hypothetical protein
LQAAVLSRGIFPAYKTNYPKPSHIKRITFTFCDLYYLLAYASPEIIKHITKASADITVDILVLCLVTLDYEVYTISKAIIVISRITDSKNPTNNKPFDKVDWDLIIMTPAYNSNKYASHFCYKNTDFTKIYTCKNKTDTIDYIDNFCQEVSRYLLGAM